jgi:tetratricopeptide (TPR) repeat protein
MGASEASAAPAPPLPRPARRRWLRRLLAGGLALAALLSAGAGWQLWQEHAARKAVAQERFDEAQVHSERALWLRPRAASTTLLAARICRLRGAYAEAEEYLSRCGQYNGMSEPLQLEWLLLRCQRGEVDQLAPGLLVLVQRGHPESADILEALAAVYMRQARYLEALDCLNRWVDLDPDCVRALDWRGWVSNQLDHRGQAISDYEHLLEIQPGRTAVRLRLVEILVDSSRCPDALTHLDRLRGELPDNPDVLVALARCRVAQLAPDEAEALLDAVLAAHPDHFQALMEKGRLELDRDRLTEAESWLRKALAGDPGNPQARYALYRSLQGQPGRQDEARQELERWRKDRRDRDRLTRLLRTELAARPNDPDLAAEAGALFLQLGEEQKGLFWLRRALAANPRHAAGHQALIAYYERTGQPDRAARQRRLLADGRAEE